MRRRLPSSPNFTPIEHAVAELKALRRQAAARTIADLRAAIAQAPPCLAPVACSNDFAICVHEPD